MVDKIFNIVSGVPIASAAGAGYWSFNKLLDDFYLSTDNAGSHQFIGGASGNITLSLQSITLVDADSPHTAALKVVHYINNTSNFTFNLPAINSTIRNRVYTIKKLNVTGDVIITANGSDTVEGSATLTLITKDEFVTIQAPGAGTDWKIIGK